VDISLPVSLRLAWWGTSWLRGHLSPDELLDGVLGHGMAADAVHTVAGLAALGLGGPEGSQPLLTGLGRLRAEGATSYGAAYPVEGDLVGLGGPPDLNAAAIDEGEAVIVAGSTGATVGLVPVRVGASVTWTAYAARRRQLPDVGDADRALRAALPRAADTLAALDVARWRPEVADLLMNLRHRDPVDAPPGVPSRCLDLAGRALHLAAVVELALVDDGGSVTAAEMSARRAALSDLARATRHALTAAASPDAWPPG